MDSFTSQIVFHPLVSQGLKFGGTTVGRDKVYRAVQFLSRFLAWYLVRRGYKLEATRWTALKSHLATARKLMRLGKPIEHLQAALLAAVSDVFPLESLLVMARQIGYFVFLSYDTIVWAQAVKFINLHKDTSEKKQRRAFQFWFASIIFSLANCAIKAARLANASKALRDSKTCGEKDLAEEAAKETKLNGLAAARRSNQRQMIIDFLDLWIPASGAGLVEVNDGLLGIAGLISSLIGAKIQWEVVNRNP